MIERPLVTFALLCFNQEQFVAEAVRAALAQDYSPLEILISDDLSTDRTWEIVQREVVNYDGPHRIRLHRNEANLSCTLHTLSALAMASADLVVFGAGDDISEPHRTSAIAAVAQAQPQAMSFWSDVRLIDEHGGDRGIVSGYGESSTDLLVMAERGAAPGGASQAYRKGIGEFFGSVDRRAASEDIVLHFRAGLLGGVERTPGVLLRWRRHIGSMEGLNQIDKGIDADRLRQHARKIATQHLFCYHARLKDLDELMQKSPHRTQEAQIYIRATERMVARYETVLGLADANPVRAARLIVQALRSGMTLRDVAKNIAVMKFPALWQRYARYRASAMARKTYSGGRA